MATFLTGPTLGLPPPQHSIGSMEEVKMALQEHHTAETRLSGEAPLPGTGRYRSLDIWRGAACLMLVIYHATFFADHGLRAHDPSTWSPGAMAIWLARRLWMGVPIFFVVSGYCIAASTDAARRGTHSMRTYLTRRIRRIYPPLWAACLVCVVFVSVAAQVQWLQGTKHLPALSEFSLGNWFGNLFALESWRTQVSGGETRFLMKNTWTLCYEEQFYFVVGLLLAAGASRFFALVGVVTLATLVARYVTRGAGLSAQGWFLDGHWFLFAIGILVNYRLHRAEPSQRRPIDLALLAIPIYALLDRRWTASPFERHLDGYLIVSSLFALLLIALFSKDAQLCRSPWLRPLAAYGKMSYSVYLTHFPLVIALSAALSRFATSADGFTAFVIIPACVLASVPIGRAFFLAVERHFLNSPATADVARPSQREVGEPQIGSPDPGMFRARVQYVE